MYKRSFGVLLALVAAFSGDAKEFDGESLEGDLTERIQVDFAVRLYNASDSVGFGANSRSGDIMPLWPHAALSDLSSKAAVVVSSRDFEPSMLREWRTNGNVGGVVLLDDGPQSFLDEEGRQTSPGGRTAAQSSVPAPALEPFDSAYVWNPFGSGVAYEDLGIPMVLVEGTDGARLGEYADDNEEVGLDGSRVWKADFNFYFGRPGRDSKECLEWVEGGSRSPRCAPLGGQSAWGLFGPPDSRPKVLAMANMDATALFHERASGANAAAATIAAMLTAADLLADSGVDLDAMPLQIGFALFQGEKWGRIGSRAFAADISNFTCLHDAPAGAGLQGGPGACLDPIHPSGAFRNLSIAEMKYLFAVEQIGRTSSPTGPLYLHSPDAPGDFAVLQNISDLADGMTGSVANGVVGQGILPPTPISSVANAAQETGQAAPKSIVIAGFNGSYIDGAFDSVNDVEDRISADAVNRAAILLARSLLLASADGQGEFADATRVTTVINGSAADSQELLDCLTQDWGCALMSSAYTQGFANLGAYLGGVTLSPSLPDPPTFYTSIIQATFGGQPVVQHQGDGQTALYGRFPSSEGNFSLDRDLIFASPTAIEEFVRVKLNDAGTRYATGSRTLRSAAISADRCSSYLDCPPCPEAASYWSGGGDAANVTMECLPTGVCACPVAYLHIALDPGIARLRTPSLFDVDESVAGAPIWTEPYWSTSVGLKVYPTVGYLVSSLTLAFGCAILVISVASVLLIKARLVKEKIL